MNKKIDLRDLPKGAQDTINHIVLIYRELSKIGRPRLRGMSVDKAISGTKELQTNHDPNFSRYQSIMKNFTRYLNKDVQKITEQINGERSRTPRKQCKDKKHPKGKQKSFGLEFEFCPHCQGKLYG